MEQLVKRLWLIILGNALKECNEWHIMYLRGIRLSCQGRKDILHRRYLEQKII